MGDSPIACIAKCSLRHPIRSASGTAVIYSVQVNCFIWAQRPSCHRAACDMILWGPFYSLGSSTFRVSYACVSYFRARHAISRSVFNAGDRAHSSTAHLSSSASAVNPGPVLGVRADHGARSRSWAVLNWTLITCQRRLSQALFPWSPSCGFRSVHSRERCLTQGTRKTPVLPGHEVLVPPGSVANIFQNQVIRVFPSASPSCACGSRIDASP